MNGSAFLPLATTVSQAKGKPEEQENQ